MAETATETTPAFQPINGPDNMENDEVESNGKRASDAADNDGSESPVKRRKVTLKAAATKTADKATPKRGAAKKVAGKSSKVIKEEASDEDYEVEEPPATPAPKTKKAAKGAKVTTPITPKHTDSMKTETVTPRGIPKCWDEADAADRAMYKMKENGKPWSEIREMWKNMTGEDTGKSSLPNRYNRIKCNMMRLEPGHERILLEAEARFEANLVALKFGQIAKEMKEVTGVAYQIPFLQKNLKELLANGGLEALPVKAPDAADDEDVEVAGEEDGDDEVAAEEDSGIKNEDEAED